VASYSLGHSDHELDRLTLQARLVGPMTRRFFQEAGMVSGMRVLDVGSGAGDVAFLAADLVGETGEVIGVDRSAAAIATATKRATTMSRRNVSFHEGDPAAMTFDRRFDAVVGRYVLLWQPDPARMLRRLITHVRPGGVVVFHEPDFDGERSSPAVPTYDRCCHWVREVLRLTGVHAHMGVGLHSTFVSAGLPAPSIRLEALVAGEAEVSDHVRFKTDLVCTLAPEIERLGIATAAEIDVATLADRVRAEVIAAGSVIVGRGEVGAWSRVGRDDQERSVSASDRSSAGCNTSAPSRGIHP